MARCLGDIDLTDRTDWSVVCSNVGRGLSAVQLQLTDNPDVSTFVSPLSVVSTNRKFEKQLQNFAQQNQLTPDDSRSDCVRCRGYEARQFAVRQTDDQWHATPLFRGSCLSDVRDITRCAVAELETLLSEYLIRSVRPDGRMVYLYYPSRGTEDRSRNNAIRQWMATVALCRIYTRRLASTEGKETEALAETIERNITFNLQSMFSVDNSFGIIDDHGKVKLGAVALAALALMESPFANRYQQQIEQMLNTLTTLWQDSGEFRTFYRPSWRREFQNFYSGEALLAWAFVLSQRPDPTLMDRFLRSFQHYRQWHLNPDNRNPAFIPWHTQAYYLIWKQTKNQELANFIFEMNDWLLDVQQVTSNTGKRNIAPTPDTVGRFYDPNRPFGPPHASSTGVYLEGLADAFALARETGDLKRTKAFYDAILLGLRSVHQLTFKDDTDMFYVSKRDRLRGGVRTTVYNNVVRVDNVQHNLMAIQKILNGFRDEDFYPDKSEQ